MSLKTLLKNKKIIIIAVVVLFVLVFFVSWFFSRKRLGLLPIDPANNIGSASNNNAAQLNRPKDIILDKVEFLNDEEKTGLYLDPKTKIQLLKRGGDGSVMVYKIINNEADIILDPSKMGPIIPSRATSTK